MNATKGYYCLVQYCPDIARTEVANVGVVLFSPDHRFIRAKISDNNKRIRKFFGQESDDYRHLDAMKEALVTRIEGEKAQFSVLEDLQQFVGTRANKILLTQPKPMKVFDPEKDLAALFKELVDHPIRELTARTELTLRKRLDNVLADVAVKRFLRRNVEVSIPTMKDKLKVPYGFQNGRFNLIQPVKFEQHTSATVKNAACKLAVEGNSLFRHPDKKFGSMQLFIVADFSEPTTDMAIIVRNIFDENNVRMFTPDGLNNLKHEIVTHGKPFNT